MPTPTVLSTPIRLKIISAVCHHERTVSQLLAEIDTTQPNMSQHLATLYRAGILGRRRDGTQIYYRLQSERVATLCRAVCTQVALELEALWNELARDCEFTLFCAYAATDVQDPASAKLLTEVCQAHASVIVS